MEVCPGKGGRGSGGFTIGVAIAIAFAILYVAKKIQSITLKFNYI